MSGRAELLINEASVPVPGGVAGQLDPPWSPPLPTDHPLSEVTNILYLLALVILTSFLICSHWLTQSQKEADIYYLFIIG